MSLGGLLAQATLGGAAQVGKGIGDRIRADAKMKRQEALAEKQTTETMKQQAHSTAMQRGTNEQTHGMSLAQQDAKNEQARGRIELTDELGQQNYEDEMGPDGKTVVGQRETGSNKLTPFTTNGDGSDLSDRQKLAVKTKMSEIEAIRESISDAGGVATDEQKQRMGRLNGEVNQIIGGVGGLTLEQLKNGVGGGQDQSGGAPSPEEKPGRVRGLLNQRMQGNEKEEQTSTIQQEVDGLLDQTDDMLNRLRPKAVPGNMGRPSPNAYQEPSAEDIQAGEELVQRLIQLDENPEYHSAISQRQRANIVQRIMELKEAGVPINLDPKP